MPEPHAPCYVHRVFDPAQRALLLAKLTLEISKLPPDVAVVGSGVSGTVIASLLAQMTSRHFAVVKKEAEVSSSHSSLNVYATAEEIGRYVIVDDLICSGKTMQRIIGSMNNAFPDSSCSMIYLYAGHRPDNVWENIPIVSIPSED